MLVSKNDDMFNYCESNSIKQAQKHCYYNHIMCYNNNIVVITLTTSSTTKGDGFILQVTNKNITETRLKLTN